ncbi:hypothetical protein Nepgr_033059 [Nepenthes gracilis]|uniref:Uncharacterized protein n=1 Tax=Nepenthes gracilis TaxID=150966 RepID=A0AAD3Y8R7_NEPGR|nr:hypothetical protein Nepgr_033059 [Nepenthes gracilis]
MKTNGLDKVLPHNLNTEDKWHSEANSLGVRKGTVATEKAQISGSSSGDLQGEAGSHSLWRPYSTHSSQQILFSAFVRSAFIPLVAIALRHFDEHRTCIEDDLMLQHGSCKLKSISNMLPFRMRD